jgi:hypothetical protein
MPDMNGEVEIRDFTLAPVSHKFKIDNDIFEAVPEIPLGYFSKLTVVAGLKMTDADAIEKILDVFDVFLTDESAVIFRKRAYDKTNPIGQRHLMPIVHWILETYGLRPTQPSSNSSDGLVDETGTSLTDGVPVVESTPQS